MELVQEFKSFATISKIYTATAVVQSAFLWSTNDSALIIEPAPGNPIYTHSIEPIGAHIFVICVINHPMSTSFI